MHEGLGGSAAAKCSPKHQPVYRLTRSANNPQGLNDRYCVSKSCLKKEEDVVSAVRTAKRLSDDHGESERTGRQQAN